MREDGEMGLGCFEFEVSLGRRVDMHSQSEVWAGDTYLGVVMMAEVPSQGTCAWLQADSEN